MSDTVNHVFITDFFLLLLFFFFFWGGGGDKGERSWDFMHLEPDPKAKYDASCYFSVMQAGIAQLVQCPAEKPGAILTWV